MNPLPWVVVAHRRSWSRLWRSRGGESVPKAGYVCGRYGSEYEAREMRGVLRPYWPDCVLKVERRA